MSQIKPFLLIQLRPEDAAADNELDAFLKFGGLESRNIHRVRIEKENIPTLKLSSYSGIIIGGGPSNVSDSENKKSNEQQRFEKELYGLLDKVTEQDFPFLGACYGIGILAKYLGGQVSKENYSEAVGAVTINLTEASKHDPLTQGLPQSFRAFAGHKEACQETPPGVTLLASSEASPVQMIKFKNNVYATQFHTELDKDGLELRINIYKHAGYFPPEDAVELITDAKNEKVTKPEIILKRFVARYATFA